MENPRRMILNVREIKAEDHSQWDKLINSSPQGSIFLLNDCLSMLAESEASLYLMRFGCFDEQDKLVGGQAFLYRKKALGIRVQRSITFSYSYTPILAGNITQSSSEYFSILKALAEKAEKSFPYFCFVCHPSIRDVRPLLDRGWKAIPDYAHTWDIHDPNTLLAELSNKRRYRSTYSDFNRLDFANETGTEIVKEFALLYRKTAHRYGLDLEETWETTFFKRMAWMLDQNAVRCLTCRKKTGELLGGSIYILSRARQTAYGWILAYDLSLGEKNFLGALYLYSLKDLSGEFNYVDIADSIRPALYDFKDSLGTDSTPFFLVNPPKAETWNKLYKTFRQVKALILKPTH
jgi:hypothetical protein